MVFSVTHTPSLVPWVFPWETGKVDYDQPSGKIVAHLDNKEVLNGTVDLESCSKITWKPDGTWVKVPALKNVHVVFMNHLDVGYDGINPTTGFVNNVLNKYFIDYFPRAIKFGYIMHDLDPDTGFIYTTHPWLLALYFNCPANFTLSDIELYCPNSEELHMMKEALKQGFIACHAGPMNMQIEMMNSYIFQMIFDMIGNFSEKHHCSSQVLSQRDVPGMTAAAIPILLRNKVKAVTVGVNPFSAPPAVPRLFQWSPYSGSKNVIMAMWHPGGYPDNPGSSLSDPGGVSIGDATISVKDGEALVFAFRTDNSGPPQSLSEIQTIFDVIRDQYPGAKVFASTLDSFVNAVNMSALPTVYGEIGDTWIQGVASDPRKTALYRAITRALRCNEDSKYSCDSEQSAFALYLSKMPEHTWGLDSVHDSLNWKNTDFNIAKKDLLSYDRIINSWLEQRVFYNITQKIIESMPNSDIYAFLQKELEGIYPVLPDLDEFTSVDPSSVFTIGDNFTIAFGKDGSVIHFNATLDSRTYTFADKSHPLGSFSYHTYNETDFQAMTAQYDYNGLYNPGYDKPNSTEAAHPQTMVYRFPMSGLYRHNKDDSIFLVQLKGDPLAHSYYGGPDSVWILVQVIKKDPLVDQGEIMDLSFEVYWMNKTATRLAEATMFSFTPALQDRKDGYWQDRIYKVAPRFSRDFSADAFVTLSAVNKNGSFYQHAVEQVNLVEQGKFGNITLGFISPEVPVVCPIYRGFLDSIATPTPFPFLEQPPYWMHPDGFAFNLHNNIWNTNYPLWYPFTDLEEDKNFKARFHMIWYKDFD